MKTIFKLKQYVVLLTAVFAMTSCLKSEDEKFYVMGLGYVNQSVRETPGEIEGQVTITSSFAPVIYAISNEVMTTCNVKAPGGESISMTKLDEYGVQWISNDSYMSTMSKLPSGTFTITAANQEGEAVQGNITINNTTEMKGKLKGDIKIADKQITVTFNKVENATNYLVILKKSQSVNLYNSIILKKYSQAEIDKSQTLTIPESSYSSYTANLQAGSYYLTIAAVITNNSEYLLYQESDIAHTTFVKE